MSPSLHPETRWELRGGHSCYPLMLQPGRQPRVQPVQIPILDQLTTRSPQAGSMSHRGGGHVALILSLFSFLAFCKSLKFGALLRVYISLPNLIFS